ncbi:MAG TPA: potassium channel family protein, partial [Acidimicrobiales bacterium]|nr:potassium channel family protein [Acidimicrobiales bacterium]
PSYLSDFERSHLVRTGARAVVTTVVLLAAYYLIPIEHRAHEFPALRLGVALAVFVVVLANEIRLISTHEQPPLRAAVAMATVIPLFLVLFAWIYLTLSHTDPTAFVGGRLTRSSALYFTVTVFSTVGFGDITPKSDPARLVVTVQMLADLAVLAVVIRLIFGAVTRGVARQGQATEADEPTDRPPVTG